MNETDIGQVLERATEGLPVCDQSQAAWRRARRVRRRRAAAAVGATVVLVAAAAAGTAAWPRGGDTPRPPADTPTPSVDARAQIQRWDPFTLPDQPRRASVLPTTLAPPASAPSVLDRPLAAAVVAWPQQGRDLMLLGTSGDWRSVPGTEGAVTGGLTNVVRPALSSDGTSVAMATDAGVRVVDVAAGHQEVWPWPERVGGPWDTPPEVRWLPGDEQVVVSAWRNPWVVGPDDAAPAPYRSAYGSGLMVDPEGPVRELDSGHLLEWQGTDLVRQVVLEVSAAQRPVTRHGLVAATGSNGWNRGGPMVLDADTGELVSAAFARERAGEYSDNGYLTAQGFLDDTTALVLVAPMDFGSMEPGEETWYLVAWDFRTGSFERITQGGSGMAAAEVAPALVGAASP